MSDSTSAALSAALDRLFKRTAHGIRPGLEIIQALLNELGHPEHSVPCIHVAGTNGKGSVCAMIYAVLQAAGVSAGCYTSPHLRHFHERIHVAGAPATDADVATWIDRVEAAAATLVERDGLRPATFFECATAMAYGIFQQRGVAWAVMETGMGGRWDATNTGQTALSVITHIDVDHTNFLGHSLVGIAQEKAGIIKPGVPVVSGPQQPEVAEIIEQTAQALRAPLIWATDMVRIDRMQQDWQGQKIRVETDQRSCRPCLLPLTGRHQLENAAIAVAAVETLAALGRIELRDQDLTMGLARTQWSARCQVLSTDPYTILDVAHNPDGARALMKALNELGGRSTPLAMITGFLEDKDVSGCLAEFARRADSFWAVPIQNRRGLAAAAVAERIAATGKPVLCSESVSDALAAARAWAADRNGMVCIAGSLYLAGEVLASVDPPERGAA